MIDSLILENFRCWRGRHEIPLCPLTLIYGINSAGKSSLFHALLLLRQTLQGARGYHVPLCCTGEHIKLGDFGTLVSDHDRSRPLSLGLSYRKQKKHPALDLLGPRRRLVLEFGKDLTVAGGASLRGMSLELDGQTLAFSAGADGFQVEPQSAALLRQLLYTSLSAEEAQADGLASALGKLQERTRFAFSRGMPANARVLLRPATEDEGDEPGEWPALLQLHNAWGGLCSLLAEELEEVLEGLRYLGPLRVVPERIQFDEAGTNRPDDVGSRGQHLAQMLEGDHGLLQEFNRILGKDGLDLGYEVAVIPLIGADGQEVPELGRARRLVLRRGALVVSMTDVGMGVSQSLPVVLQVLLGRYRSLSMFIEQPEAHLNPAITAQLAQLMVDVVSPPPPDPSEDALPESQILFESHAPEMALRAANCVRRGEIATEAVSILYIKQEAGSALAITLEFNPDGTLDKPWPEVDGFFPERAYEVKELGHAAKRVPA